MTTPAPTDAPLPTEFDSLTFAEKVAIQTDHGAKEVRVWRIEDDGSETELFPVYAAHAFDTAHVARDHGIGLYKGIIFAPRGRRMAGTDRFKVNEAPVTKPSAQSDSAAEALNSQLRMLREELTAVKEAAGKRRTMADMTPDEFRSLMTPPAQPAPAPGWSMDKVLAALPVIVPLFNHFKPKSNVQELAALLDLGERIKKGGGKVSDAPEGELAALERILDHPVVTGVAARFARDDSKPIQGAPPKVTSPAALPGTASPAATPAADATAPAPATPSQVETPASNLPADLRMLVSVAAKKLADEVDAAPATSATEAAEAVMADTAPELVTDFLAKFEPGALAMAMQQVEPRFKDKIVWLTMLEGALRLASETEADDEDGNAPLARNDHAPAPTTTANNGTGGPSRRAKGGAKT